MLKYSCVCFEIGDLEHTYLGEIAPNLCAFLRLPQIGGGGQNSIPPGSWD